MAEDQKETSREQKLEELRRKVLSQPGVREAMEVYGNWRRLETIRESQKQAAVPGGSISVSGATNEYHLR